MRLDKFLCEEKIGSRKEVKQYIKNKMVTVNDMLAVNPEQQIDPYRDQIAFRGNQLQYQKYYYYCMHKPAGVITATEDKQEKTVMELFPKELYRDDLFPVGRLDKDTTGLLLFTNDGELGHRLLSAKYHVYKTYLVTTRKEVSLADCKALEQGVTLGEDGVTLPAICKKIENTDSYQITLSIREGKFHQVKRMLQAVDNEVIALKRISFGELLLEETLQEGQMKALTLEEVKKLYEAVHLN